MNELLDGWMGGWMDGWTDGLMERWARCTFLCWATSSLSDLCAEAPLPEATSSLSSHLSGLLLVWNGARLPGYLFCCSFCNPVFLLAPSTMRFAMSSGNSRISQALATGVWQHHWCFAERSSLHIFSVGSPEIWAPQTNGFRIGNSQFQNDFGPPSLGNSRILAS